MPYLSMTMAEAVEYIAATVADGDRAEAEKILVDYAAEGNIRARGHRGLIDCWPWKYMRRGDGRIFISENVIVVWSSLKSKPTGYKDIRFRRAEIERQFPSSETNALGQRNKPIGQSSELIDIGRQPSPAVTIMRKAYAKLVAEGKITADLSIKGQYRMVINSAEVKAHINKSGITRGLGEDTFSRRVIHEAWPGTPQFGAAKPQV